MNSCKRIRYEPSGSAEVKASLSGVVNDVKNEHDRTSRPFTCKLGPTGSEVGLFASDAWIGSSSRANVVILWLSFVFLIRSAHESSCWTSSCSLKKRRRNALPHVANRERRRSCKRLQTGKKELVLMTRAAELFTRNTQNSAGLPPQ